MPMLLLVKGGRLTCFEYKVTSPGVWWNDPPELERARLVHLITESGDRLREITDGGDEGIRLGRLG